MFEKCFTPTFTKKNLGGIYTTVLLLCSSHSLSATVVQDFIPDLDIVN